MCVVVGINDVMIGTGRNGVADDVLVVLLLVERVLILLLFVSVDTHRLRSIGPAADVSRRCPLAERS